MKKLKHSKTPLYPRKGQALTEYLILTALIAVASISIVQVMSSNLRRKMSTVSEAIRGEAREFEGIRAEERHYKIYDMGDFHKGIIDSQGR
jgi:Flp pilus assembly pilin Flp